MAPSSMTKKASQKSSQKSQKSSQKSQKSSQKSSQIIPGQGTHVHPEAFAPSGHGHLPRRGQRHGQRQAAVPAEKPELLVERHGQRHLAGMDI